MTPEEERRAIRLYEEIHTLLTHAKPLPPDDMERWRLSLRYNEVRGELQGLLRKAQVPL